MLKRLTSTRAKWRDEAGGALLIVFMGAGLAGWLMNIGTIWRTAMLDGATLIRVIGIPFWPLGAIIGWL